MKKKNKLSFKQYIEQSNNRPPPNTDSSSSPPKNKSIYAVVQSNYDNQTAVNADSQSKNDNIPAKTKSHYFVQSYDVDEHGWKTCPYCGKRFKPRNRRIKYCSSNCQYLHQRETTLRKYHQNRDVEIEKRRKRRRERAAKRKRERPPVIYARDKNIIINVNTKKCIIIKQELLNLELLTVQLLKTDVRWENKRNSKHIFDHMRLKYDEEKINMIKDRLTEYELPDVKPRPVSFPAEDKNDIREYRWRSKYDMIPHYKED